MTISGSLLTGGSSGTDASSQATASITPTGSTPVLAWIIARVTSGSPNSPSLSGCGITWGTAIADFLLTDTRLRMTVFLGSAASPSTGALTFSYGATTHAFAWGVTEFPGVDTSGSAVQVVTDAQATGEPTVTLAAFGDAGNATVFICGGVQGLGYTEDAGWTELDDQFATPPSCGVAGYFRADNDTTPSATSGNPAVAWGGVGIELKAAGAAAITGTASITLGAVTTTAAGALPIVATANLTLDAVTAGATGALAIAGTANLTLGAVTATAAGALPIVGVANLTLGSVTVTATAALLIQGAATLTLGPVTVTGTGVGQVTTAGEANITLGAVTMVATGALPLAAAGSVTLGPITTTAAGVLPIAGTLSLTLGAITVQATGFVGTTYAVVRLTDWRLLPAGLQAVALVPAGLEDVTLIPAGLRDVTLTPG